MPHWAALSSDGTRADGGPGHHDSARPARHLRGAPQGQHLRGRDHRGGRLSDRYITARFLPDKAIDLLDQAAARVKLSATARTGGRCRSWSRTAPAAA